MSRDAGFPGLHVRHGSEGSGFDVVRADVDPPNFVKSKSRREGKGLCGTVLCSLLFLSGEDGRWWESTEILLCFSLYPTALRDHPLQKGSSAQAMRNSRRTGGPHAGQTSFETLDELALHTGRHCAAPVEAQNKEIACPKSAVGNLNDDISQGQLLKGQRDAPGLHMHWPQQFRNSANSNPKSSSVESSTRATTPAVFKRLNMCVGASSASACDNATAAKLLMQSNLITGLSSQCGVDEKCFNVAGPASSRQEVLEHLLNEPHRPIPVHWHHYRVELHNIARWRVNTTLQPAR